MSQLEKKTHFISHPVGSFPAGVRFVHLLLLLFCLVLAPSAKASDVPSPEYAIKAAFLYNFGKFIEWPFTKGLSPYPSEFHIAILGNDPFKETMDIIKGKEIRGLKVRVRRIGSIDEILGKDPCHILFISASERNRLPEIVRQVSDYPILTVADHENAASAGIMINLRSIDQRIRFDINLKSALDAGVIINSKLLKLAVVIVE